MSEDSIPAFIKSDNLKESVMEILRKIFPLSFKRVDTVANLVIGILGYVAALIVAGIIFGIAGLVGGLIPLVGAIFEWMLGVVSTVVGAYILFGMVIRILVFTKVIKE